MRFGSMKIFLFFIVHPNLFLHATGDQQWCSYKFYTDLKSWFEAKAICEQANMTLAHINITQHDYIWSLIPYSLSQMYTNLPSSALWLGGFRLNNGKPTWQDDCEEIDNSDYTNGGNDQEEACMKMEKTNTEFGTENCTESMPFLCQGSTTDIKNCYTTTTEVWGLSRYTEGYTNMENCYDHCACSNCYGISHFADGNSCVMLSMTNNTKKRTKPTLYVKDLVRTAPVDVSPTITELHDMCSTRVITSSQQQDDIPLTSLPYSDTATPHTSTPLTSESTGRINLQPSSTPSELDKTSEMSTPFLSHDVTSVDLTKTSLPTVPVNSGTISPSRTTCSPIKTTAINQEELEEKVQQLRSDLLVDKKKLSSWKRTLTSAADDRQSAANIGYVGVLVVCLIPLIIILMDLGRIHKGIKQFRSRVNKKRTLPPDQIT